MRRFLLIFVITIFSSFANASLGISPAIIEINFEPSKEQTITYSILSDNPSAEIDIFIDGDLKEYVEIDKNYTVGPSTFILTISFPEKIEKPGINRISVGAKERPPENQFIGTAIDIRATIKVHVPYPGKYAEVNLNVGDANIGEQIPVEGHIISRGSEKINVDTSILFLDSENKLIEKMDFERINLSTNEEKYFRRYLDTTNYKAGDYKAELIAIHEGGKSNITDYFRIGSLFVNLTNLSKEIPSGGIQRIYLDVESRWNDVIDEVFADLNFTNGIENYTIRTPSISLEKWEKNRIEGFIDTTKMLGEYNVTINLVYGEGSSLFFEKINVYKVSNKIKIILISIILTCLLIGGIYYFWKRKNKQKEK